MEGLAADTSQLGVSGSGSLLAFTSCGFGAAGQRWLVQLKPDPLDRADKERENKERRLRFGVER